MSKFLGTHSRNIDDKQRIPLPRVFRDVLGDSVGIVTRLAGTLQLYTEAEFDDMLDRLRDDVRANRRDTDLLRGLAGNAYPVRPDAQNRIKLPRQIMSDDELSGELVLIGIGHRAEIRPAPRHADVAASAAEAASIDGQDYM
jgi:MraZ protein